MSSLADIVRLKGTPTSVGDFASLQSHPEVQATIASFPHQFIHGLRRRLMRERRRRKVGRAYDMAIEIARMIPRGSNVLDVGCGNGFIAHHLSSMLGTNVI